MNTFNELKAAYIADMAAMKDRLEALEARIEQLDNGVRNGFAAPDWAKGLMVQATQENPPSQSYIVAESTAAAHGEQNI